MARALILASISPEIGGVLVRGEKGTAKSTMVRALTEVLPRQDVVDGCRFRCDPARPDPDCLDGPHPSPEHYHSPVPLVELPVGASEDRVTGSLDLQAALGKGQTSFEPGLLAAAHRGILYVDEVNLLHDHLVDLLLDAAAMGRNTVERDGVSVAHAARLMLVGTMNPEEGELRPQLLDRFGLTVEVSAPRDPDVRVEIVRRRMAFDSDPAGFRSQHEKEQDELASRIAAAQRTVGDVALPDSMLRKIAQVCAGFDVDGMRADIVTARAARANAAWEGRTRVTRADIRVAALLALPGGGLRTGLLVCPASTRRCLISCWEKTTPSLSRTPSRNLSLSPVLTTRPRARVIPVLRTLLSLRPRSLNLPRSKPTPGTRNSLHPHHLSKARPPSESASRVSPTNRECCVPKVLVRARRAGVAGL